jgi:hypothetical protein
MMLMCQTHVLFIRFDKCNHGGSRFLGVAE